MGHPWNDFQKATKGQFISRQEAAAVWNAWDQGTFPTKIDSLLYHLDKHGKGRTLSQYTAAAGAFWSRNRSAAVWGTWNAAWARSFRLKVPPRGGYFTSTGGILTFWD